MGKVNEDYALTFAVGGLSGARTSIAPADFTITIRNPQNTASDNPSVLEVGDGMYRFTIPAAFTLVHGAGQYGVTVELNTTGPIQKDIFGDTVEFSLLSSDDIVGAVWRELLADHQTVAGSFAETQMLIAGLVQNNYVLDNITHDPSSRVMTAGRMRIFSTSMQVAAATDGGSGEGELATFEVQVVLDPLDSTKVDLYKVKKL